MALQIEQLDDLIHSLHKRFDGEPGKHQDISLPLQKYHYAARLFDRAKRDGMGTDRVRWKLQVRNNDNFQVVGLYHRDSSSRVNMMEEGNMLWGMSTTNYHYDLDEPTFRQGGRAIYDYANQQEMSMMKDYFAGMENLMFGAGPTAITQTPFPPVGLLHWVTSTSDSTTENNATEGFNGAAPLGFGAVGAGSIDDTAFPAWKNRTFPYVQVTMQDAVRKTIRAMNKCMFEAPIRLPNIVSQDRPNWELLTTYSRIELFDELQQLQNENLGKDLFTGGTTVRGVALKDIPAWTNSESVNARTDGIILGVNWATFKFKHNTGRSMRKRKAYQHPEMSNVRIRKMDDAGQIVCFDRRANFRGYSSETVTETD